MTNPPSPTAAPRRLLTLAVAALAAFLITLAAEAGASGDSGGIGTEEEATTRQVQDDGARSRYDRIWRRTARKHKRWARRTATCESGRDPKAIGGGGRYRGAFQFMRSTWRAAPKSPGGDPIRFNYRTQAVVAIKLKQRDGRRHWPSCG